MTRRRTPGAGEQHVSEILGFDAVVIGSLAKTREFDLGQPLARGNLTAADLRKLADG